MKIDQIGEVPPAAVCKDPFILGALALACAGMLIVVGFGLIPLLYGLLGARAASLALAKSRLLSSKGRLAKALASACVGAIALAICVGVSVWAVQSGRQAVKEAPLLAVKISQQAQQWRAMLPAVVADKIPEGQEDIQEAIASAVAGQMSGIAGAGKTWAVGILFALVGWIIGLVMANMEPPKKARGPLGEALARRGAVFSDIFVQVVVGQSFVACANTFFAAIFMLIILPLAGYALPWTGALLAMTMILSMIPAAGNVVCNGVVAMVALTVGPGVAVASLVYLILVHKVEYFINARAVGRRVDSSIAEMLLAMFVLEALFGVSGLVAAPLYYAYFKSELRCIGWL